MKKVFLAGILLMLIATIFVFSGAPKTSTPATSLTNDKKKELTNLAQQKFQEEKSQGKDMSNGPCLGLIAQGWVADVVHNPRQPVDDKPENQCEDYRSGKVSHFIELDTNGNFIRMQ